MAHRIYLIKGGRGRKSLKNREFRHLKLRAWNIKTPIPVGSIRGGDTTSQRSTLMSVVSELSQRLVRNKVVRVVPSVNRRIRKT
jgi:hypothetical protein